MRTFTFKLVLVVFVLVGELFLTRQANSMPCFARKYGLGCATCHTTVPRLNEFGFRFRAAGFRMPDEIGTKADTAFSWGNYLVGALSASATDASTNPPNTPSTSTFTLGLDEVLLAMTGAMTPSISGDLHLTYDPSAGSFGLDKAFIQYTAGTEDGFFTTKVGVMNPFQGYQASDEPMGLSRPLIEETPASGHNGSTLFTSWELNQFGIELGYSLPHTSFRATIFRGIYPDGNGAAVPIQGTTPKPEGPSKNSLDLQLFATQFLTEEGAALSGYFYLGNVDLPTGIASPDSALFQDKFLRYAIYGTLPISHAQLLAGFQQGMDNSWDIEKWVKGTDFTSAGWFVEADYLPFDLFGFGARYDQFRPSTAISDNALNQITGFVNYSFGNGLQVVGEYQHLTTQQGPGAQEADNSVGLSLVWIH